MAPTLIIAQTTGARSEGHTERCVPRPGPSRSLFTYAPELLLVFVVMMGAGFSADPDLWGHIRFGQETLSRLAVVHNDPYSYTAFGHPWHNHEWLTEVIMALLYNKLGVIGLKLWKFAGAGAIVSLLTVGMNQTGASARIQLSALAVCVVTLMPSMQFRPQLFTFVLFAGLLALLAADRYRGGARLWTAVPLMALWANLHGGFIIGVAALTIYAPAVAIVGLVRRRTMERACLAAAVAIAATAATLLTPYGLDNWLAVIHAVGNPLTRRLIQDWESPLVYMSWQQFANRSPTSINIGLVSRFIDNGDCPCRIRHSDAGGGWFAPIAYRRSDVRSRLPVRA